jgi:hypothetical protein
VFTHVPSQQVGVSPVQAPPQDPQLFGSVSRLAHVVPQHVVPSVQAGLHPVQLPDTHVWPAAHGLPQVPQFAGSVPRLAHVPLQQVVPSVQAGLHPVQLPDTHVWPAAHGLPQVPQFAGSVPRLAHVPLQHVVPGAHVAPPQVHAKVVPLGAQLSPAGHALPQEPQFVAVVMFTQVKLQQASSAAQAIPHWLQLPELVERLVHTPLQHASPKLHAKVEPHPPQSDVLVSISTQ